ncbi:MAG: putative lipid II flippase FtsW [Proteobacteria bacterium]|nr:putative lipid II flippase FtsW [Pseudomonadota bacterium]NIS72028.1 putative lipid II flippase FtsW [Pseudomonadota bacterium]
MTDRFRFDFSILLITLILAGFGIVMVYSTSAILAADELKDSFYFLKKQALFATGGVFLMALAMRINYHLWQKLAYPILAVSLLLLTLVLVSGTEASGATRWLYVGPLSFQPSELSKLALVVFLSYFLTKKGAKIRTFQFGFLPAILIPGAMILLVIHQPDFGAALFLGIIVMLMLFAAGTRLSYILSMALIAAPVVYYLIVKVPYRLHRIMSYLNPWNDPQGTSFQLVQSLVAFGGGGIFGSGLGQGKQKLFFLPAPHTDFIFSVIGEEIGLIGALIVLGLFLVLCIRGIRVSLDAPDEFGTYLGLGITSLISLQAIINMAVVLGLLPTKGLTLPFISYGGTSLVVSFVSVGILLNISSHALRGAVDRNVGFSGPGRS